MSIVDKARGCLKTFEQDTKNILVKNGGKNYSAGVKVAEAYNDDSAPSKAMWRLISKIFEDKYTDNDYK